MKCLSKNYHQDLKKRWKRSMSPWVIKRYGLMQVILYIIKRSGNYRKRAENLGKIENPSKGLNFYQRKVAMKQFWWNFHKGPTMFVCDFLTWEWWIFIKIEIFQQFSCVPTVFVCQFLAPSSLKSLNLKKITFGIELAMTKAK